MNIIVMKMVAALLTTWEGRAMSIANQLAIMHVALQHFSASILASLKTILTGKSAGNLFNLLREASKILPTLMLVWIVVSPTLCVGSWFQSLLDSIFIIMLENFLHAMIIE